MRHGHRTDVHHRLHSFVCRRVSVEVPLVASASSAMLEMRLLVVFELQF